MAGKHWKTRFQEDAKRAYKARDLTLISLTSHEESEDGRYIKVFLPHQKGAYALINKDPRTHEVLDVSLKEDRVLTKRVWDSKKKAKVKEEAVETLDWKVLGGDQKPIMWVMEHYVAQAGIAIKLKAGITSRGRRRGSRNIKRNPTSVRRITSSMQRRIEDVTQADRPRQKSLYQSITSLLIGFHRDLAFNKNMIQDHVIGLTRENEDTFIIHLQNAPETHIDLYIKVSIDTQPLEAKGDIVPTEGWVLVAYKKKQVYERRCTEMAHYSLALAALQESQVYDPLLEMPIIPLDMSKTFDQLWSSHHEA